MKRDLIRVAGVLLIIIFIAFFIYPTIHYYPHTNNDSTIIKVNRVTGDSYVLDPQLQKWRKINQN